MNVLITGGAGFIGAHVAQAFHEDGFNVFILDPMIEQHAHRFSFPYTALPYSILDPICEQLFHQYPFQVVVHLAAQVSVGKSVARPEIDAKLNIIGLLRILKYARQFHVKKFIFASSAAVYGNNTALPLDELQLPAPIAPYGISKLAGEHYCLIENSPSMQTVVLRFSNVFGPYQTTEGEGGVVATFIANALQQKPLMIHGSGEQTRDFIYVADVAQAILTTAKRNVHGILNVSTQTETSVQHIVSIIEQLHGTVSTTYSARRLGDIDRSILHNGRLQQYGWTPKTSIEQGLAQTYAWAQQALFPI